VNRFYEDFKNRFSEITHLRTVLQALSWDQETMMPELGAPHRAAQVSTVAVLQHQRLTDPSFRELLSTLETRTDELDLWGRASIQEARRQYDRATRLPETLVKTLAETAALAYEAWVQARSESDYAAFAPWLKKIVSLKREEARCLAGETAQHDYDALLDGYEPGMTVAQLDPLFAQFRPKLTALLGRIVDSGRQPVPLPPGPYPVQAQDVFNREVLTALGFDWKAGRLDTAPHPFCSGFSPCDVRITTRYSTTEISKALFGTIHECGHALYEQGLDAQYYGLPACDAVSLGIHESQSRLWENQVGRSHDFWEFWLPRARRHFPPHFDDFSLDEFVWSINRVAATPIRVEADEVTYGLHVILRYELEKELLTGTLGVSDLEEAWNERMAMYLGFRPENAAEGVLQDTHWSQGLVAYFPTYLLGNLYAAQIFDQATKEIPDLGRSIARGDLISLREWLRRRIHRHGKTRSARELIQELTGAALSSRHFLDYLEDKFGRLYGLA
jgi:carboxypeptidase Taq